MDAPSHFDETRLDVLHALIGAHPLATLVSGGAAGLDGAGAAMAEPIAQRLRN